MHSIAVIVIVIVEKKNRFVVEITHLLYLLFYQMKKKSQY